MKLATMPRTLEEAIDDLNERNGITYELRAVTKNGDVLVIHTSEQSFSDVAGYAMLGDEEIEEIARLEQNVRAELRDDL